MYREIPAKDKQIKKVVIETPLDDYELLDFGNGCKLERFGNSNSYTLPDEVNSGPGKYFAVNGQQNTRFF